VTLGYEDIGVRGAVERLLDQGAVAVIAAVGVSDFLTDGLGFEGLFGFNFGYGDIEIVALRPQGAARRRTLARNPGAQRAFFHNINPTCKLYKNRETGDRDR